MQHGGDPAPFGRGPPDGASVEARLRVSESGSSAGSSVGVCERWLGRVGDGRTLTIALGGVKLLSMQQEEAGSTEPPNFAGKGAENEVGEGVSSQLFVTCGSHLPPMLS